jgi:hypothetical protein
VLEFAANVLAAKPPEIFAHTMTLLDIFLNRHDRLRSGWRFAIFCALYYAAAAALALTIYALAMLTTRGRDVQATAAALPGWFNYLASFFVLFVPAVLLGWGCGRLLDGVPWRAQGWTTHRGWLRDLLLGSLIGACALALAALVATAGGGFHFGAGAPLLTRAFVKTFFGAAGV